MLIGGGAAILLGGALHGLTPFGPAGGLGMAAVAVAGVGLGGLVLAAVKRSLDAKGGIRPVVMRSFQAPERRR